MDSLPFTGSLQRVKMETPMRRTPVGPRSDHIGAGAEFAAIARFAEERRAFNPSMTPRTLYQLVAFTLNRQPYALLLASVRQVLRMVEVTPLPKAPEIVLGVINLHGTVVPVLSIRRRMGLVEAEALSDQLIVADTASRRVALVVDAVTGIVERTTEEIIKAGRIVPGAEHVEGIAKLEEGMLFIHNLDLFLSQPEEIQLHDALAKGQGAE